MEKGRIMSMMEPIFNYVNDGTYFFLLIKLNRFNLSKNQNLYLSYSNVSREAKIKTKTNIYIIENEIEITIYNIEKRNRIKQH